MESSASVITSPPESCEPLTLSSRDNPHAFETDSLETTEHGEENKTTDLTFNGDMAKDDAQENQQKRPSFVARGRTPFRGWNGRAPRWRAGGRGNIYHYPIRYGIEAMQFHTGNYWQEKSAVLASSEHQPAAIESASKPNPSAQKPYFPPQVPQPLLSWCDVCRVDCSIPEVLEIHKSGKRHKKTVQLLEKMQGLLEAGESIISEPPGDLVNDAPANIIEVPARKSSKKKKRKKTEPEQPRFCVPCNSACNSQAMFDAHLAGKRHTTRISRFLNQNTVYGLISDQNPLDQSSAQAPQDAQQPLYYGLVSSEQPQSFTISNPHLQQPEQQDCSEGQYGFTQP